MTIPATAPEYTTIGPIPSGGSFVYNAVLVQKNGVTPIAAGMLQTLTLTFVDVDTQDVINSRDEQDVFNAHGVTVDDTDDTGALEWIAEPDDNPFVRIDPPPCQGDVEKHLAVFKWTWTDGSLTLANAQKVFVLVESYQNVDKSSSGDGSAVYSDYVYEPDNVTPVDQARVWVTSDSAGEMLVAGPQRTTPLGQFTFRLDPGTYYLWVDSPSFALSGPNTITVS